MLRYVLRRLLWMLPVMLSTTLVLFLFVSQLPQSPNAASAESSASLPLFVNVHPQDVRQLAASSVDALLANASPEAEKHLVRLGGAALPYVLPRLLDLPCPAASCAPLTDQQKAHVALSLEPIAKRMGLATPTDFSSGPQALQFWSRFWDERSIDFKPAIVRRAVRRLLEHDAPARRRELIELDTFALDGLLSSLRPVQSQADVPPAARLMEVAAHITSRELCMSPTDSVRKANRCISQWRTWWLTTQTDYVLLSGPERVSAMLLDTRYGHWALEALTLRFGVSHDGAAVFDKLARRGPRTLSLTLISLALAYSLAIPLGLLSAKKGQSSGQRKLTRLMLLVFSVPCPVVVMLLGGLFGWRFAVSCGAAAIGLGLVTSPWRQQQLASLDPLKSDYVRTAKAQGLSPARLLFVHTAKATLLVPLSLFATDFPLALSGACVVEKAFGLRGIGADLVQAAVQHDVAFLMGFGLVAMALSTLLLFVSDLLSAWLDPRVGSLLARGTS